MIKPAAYGGPVVVRQPVRGGQVIYAQNNDLVVLAPVNAGAQVVADGHVHIYSKLRGRAVAGAKGLPGARIFVQRLEAELVAVSDAYMSAEENPGRRARQGRPDLAGGRPVQSGAAVSSPHARLALTPTLCPRKACPHPDPLRKRERGNLEKNLAVRRNDR